MSSFVPKPLFHRHSYFFVGKFRYHFDTILKSIIPQKTKAKRSSSPVPRITI